MPGCGCGQRSSTPALVAVFALLAEATATSFSRARFERVNAAFYKVAKPGALDPEKLTGVAEIRLGEGMEL